MKQAFDRICKTLELPLFFKGDKPRRVGVGGILKKATFFLLFLFSLRTIACDCPPLPTISVDACKGYDVIFKGKVDSISPCVKGKSLAWFTLSRLYLGEAFERQAVEFDCESDCQMSFAKGEEWLIYAKFISYGDYGLGFCGRSRKHFSDTLNDYHMQTHHMSFSLEEKYLQDQLGLKKIKNEAERNKNTYHNPQPSDSSKIWLLVVSFLGMIVFYYFFASSRFRRKK